MQQVPESHGLYYCYEKMIHRSWEPGFKRSLINNGVAAQLNSEGELTFCIVLTPLRP